MLLGDGFISPTALISRVHGSSGPAWWLLWSAWKPLGLGRGKHSLFRIVPGACRRCFVDWGTKQGEQWAAGRDTLLQRANARTPSYPWAVCQGELSSEKILSHFSSPSPWFWSFSWDCESCQKGCVQQDSYPPFSRNSQGTGPQKGRCREHCDLHLVQIPLELRHYKLYIS